MTEEWRPVLGWEGFYEVSDMGRVRSLYRPYQGGGPGRIIKPRIIKGYNYAHLSARGVTPKKVRICRMVLQAFEGDQPSLVARHRSGNSLDDRLSNLIWGTHQDNSDDAKVHGTILKGENHPHSKLTEDDVRFIRANVIKRGDRTKMAKQFGVAPTLISAIIHNQAWNHVT